jgi:hypothetical protein
MQNGPKLGCNLNNSMFGKRPMSHLGNINQKDQVFKKPSNMSWKKTQQNVMQSLMSYQKDNSKRKVQNTVIDTKGETEGRINIPKAKNLAIYQLLNDEEEVDAVQNDSEDKNSWLNISESNSYSGD